ncbi:hypothetical protein BC477_04045 [Clavibacter michiganensis subsp. michiganensis]|uniref:Uncharacterized protein n=1 Tax=Clavibacter michiganensis subsp. michiganensis TaxID=33013 RepID=A0A251XL03_CLAMM|nr:hypothetical protein BC477_04045 [Clavibacter michiganensis subsp. michiganensis]OUE03883.1 hypothetical protein CMMCAS07_02980 [Clavibacter michiganensis subsp. michiganensis]
MVTDSSADSVAESNCSTGSPSSRRNTERSRSALSSAESRSIRVASWPAGTVVAYWSSALAGPVPEMGEDASFGFAYTRPAVRPSAVSAIGPVVPGVTVTSTDPVIPFPCTSSGAAMETGFTAIGLRTVVSPSVQVRDPVA